MVQLNEMRCKLIYLFFSDFFNFVVNRLLFYDFPRKISYYVNPLSNYFYYLNIVTFKSLENDHR